MALFLASTCLLSLSGYSAQASTIPLLGAGASLPKEVYTTWMAAYKAHRSQFVQLEMVYDSRGSGHGKGRIKGEIDGLVHYAGSDSLLSEDDYENHPELQMFPTLAGPIVMAFNVPELEELTLSREAIVGIYNGTVASWSHPAIRATNPDANLPNEPIKPVARHDKSGMTEIFTNALSQFSAEWAKTYGAFSGGLGEDSQPLHWNPSVVQHFGKRVYGVTDAIKEQKYSIGYTTPYLAGVIGVPYAHIINRYGKLVDASQQSVQAAMDTKLSDMTERLTVSLVDAPGTEAYPLVDFTYMIVRMDTESNCESYVALNRYIQWVLTDDQARGEAEQFGMISVSENLAKRIKSDVVEKITCGGDNVYEIAEEQRRRELISLQTWRTPVAIVTPLVGCLIIAMCVYLLYQRVKYLKALDNNAWDIAVEDITFIFPNDTASIGMSRSRSMGSSSSQSDGISVNIDTGAEQVKVDKVLQWPGKWEGHLIGLRVMRVPETSHISRPVRHELTWMREKIIMENVVRLYGLTSIDGEHFIINEFCPKGALNDLLQNEKYQINLGLKYSLASDVAKGMLFLHQKGIIHGNLNSSCCLLDSKWTVKISDWEHLRLFTSIMVKDPKKKKKVSAHDPALANPTLYIRSRCEQERGSHAKHFMDLWTAPEVSKDNYANPPTEKADMFSYAIVVQEIFTRNDPYSELMDKLEPRELLLAIQFQNLRPQHGEETPVKVRQIMELCWHDTPSSRPTFDQVHKLLRNANTSKKSVLENMMEAMEEYTRSLEEKMEQHTDAMSSSQRNVETMLTRFLPTPIAHKLSLGEAVQPQDYTNTALALLKIHMFHSLATHATSSQLIQFLSQIHQILDPYLAEEDIHVLAEQNDQMAIITGVGGDEMNAGTNMLQLAKTCVQIFEALKAIEQPFGKNGVDKQSSDKDTVTIDIDKENTADGQPTSNGSNFVKITLHSGSVATGVVGTTVPRYIIYGDAVSVCEGLQTIAEPAKMLISEKAQQLLKPHKQFSTNKHQQVTVQGKAVATYWLSHDSHYNSMDANGTLTTVDTR